jgi:PKD repeat protein
MMKGFAIRFAAFPMLLLLMLASSHVFSEKSEREEEREKLRKHKPARWPKQKITQRTISISPPHEVNFQQQADYQLAHPKPPRTGFIGQEEDKDADFKFVPHVIPAGTPRFDPAQMGNSSSSNGRGHTANSAVHQRDSPAPLGYFLGTAGNGSLIPPDVSGATGPTYVMETNNQQFDIYTKTGTLHSTLSIDNFFTGGVTGGYFDPHIVYDNAHQKFIVVIDGNINGNNDGGLFIAVSQTSDPTGSWWTYDIDNGDASTNDLLDYPQLGYNENWVVISANDFIGNNVTEDIYVLNRASMYTGTLGTVKLFTDNNAFSWAPAQTYDTTVATLWMVQDGNGGSGAMQIGSITGTVANPVYNAGSNVAVTSTWNENAVDVQQYGGATTKLINDDDTRVGNGSVFVNGKLWFTHAIWLPATGTATNAGVDWWSVTPATLTVNQFGRIASPANGTTVPNYYYPTINVNSNNDALLGYCVSGSDSFYASAAYSFRAGTDAVNTMQSRYIYKPGVATYYETLGGTRNRYGDYTGTMVDPVDQSFWNFSEWAYTATKWGTVIAHVAAATPPTVPPVASFSSSITAVTCNGLVAFTDLSTNDPTSWLWNFGDGATSALQNPSHQYTTNGTYTVSLKATNAYGNNTQTQTALISVSLPAGPAAPGVSHCGSSTFSLSATTTDAVGWFDTTGAQVSGANPFVTPVLAHTTTYYVQDTVISPIDSVGPATYTTLGTGGNFANTNQHYLTFDALSNFTLISVLVDASTAGARTIQLYNSGGTVIATATPTIPAGVSRVTLNFSVPEGTGYELSCGGTGTAALNLYRNNAVATGAYPFTLASVVSITGSDQGTGYYYFFYDWKVQGVPCVSARTPVVATVYPGGLAATSVPTAVACYGGATGSASLTTTGGTSAYTYHWSTGGTTDTITGLTANTYTVTITDVHSCTATATATISQPSAAVSVTGAISNPTCQSVNSGAVILTVTGGTSAYHYLWSTSPAQTGDTAHTLTGGSYTVTVTDAHNCTSTKTFNVTAPTTPVFTTSTVATTCGTSTGSASVSGSTGYTYSWSSGSTAATATGLAAGTYTVTVSAGACSTTASVTVGTTGGPALTPSSTATTCGSNNGTVSVSVANPVSPTYTWSGGIGSTASVSNVASGTYTVTVNNNGCTASTTVSVASSAAPSLTPSSTTTTCGGANGSVSVSVANPVSPTYTWSGGIGSTASVSSVASGTYTVTVNNNGCTATTSVSVATSTAPALTPSSIATTCGNANGTASISVANPVSPVYHWSNSSATASITNVASGSYTVTVTNNGCTATTTVSVGASSAPALTPSATATTCGNSNGAASVSVANPVGPAYHWSNSNTTSAITNLAAGSYTVTVTNNGCTATTTVSVAASTGLSLQASSTSSTCGGSNGTASVSVTNPVNPVYSWTGGSTAATATGLAAGTYTVTVTSNGCTATASASVSSTGGPSTTSSFSNTTCGNNNGTAAVAIVSGAGPYTYSWSNSATDSVQTGLASGTYTVTVRDANGCASISSVTVAGSASVSLTPASTTTTCGGSNGSVSVTVASPVSPTYSWSGGIGSTASISGVASGTYTVTVHNNGCTATTSVTVAASTGVVVQTSSVATTCGGGTDGSASVTVTNPVSPAYHWSNSSTTATITGLAAGTYHVTITDNGCTTSTSVTVGTGAGSLSLLPVSVADSCYGGASGTASVSVTGGSGTYSYAWSNSQTGATIRGLSAGRYIVTVSDAGGGCSSFDTITVTQPVQLSLTRSTGAVACYGESNGSASVTVSGGTPNYSYAWNNSELGSTITGLTAGTYVVTVSDANHCAITSTLTVSQPATLTATVTTTPITFSSPTGSATVSSISGGTAPYTVLWSNGATGNTVTTLPLGIYTATITDSNGCQATDTFHIIRSETGINTVDGSIGFSIYPNPARTEVLVDLQAVYDDVTISLRDMLGQTLISQPVTASQVTLDVTPYATGVYFIEIAQGARKSVKKLIINNK